MEPPQRREKSLGRSVRLTRGREGRDPRRLLLEPIFDEERERESRSELWKKMMLRTMLVENGNARAQNNSELRFQTPNSII